MGRGRSEDDDMKFWGAMASKIATPRSKMVEVRANFVFTLVVMMICYFGWCVWDRFRGDYPVTVNSISALATDVRAGGKLYVRYDLYRHRTCEVDSEYTFIDAQNRRTRFSLPHSNASGAPGPDTAVRGYDVPIDMAIGPAKLRLMVSWACPENLYEAIYPITRVLPEIHFNVLPSDTTENP